MANHSFSFPMAWDMNFTSILSHDNANQTYGNEKMDLISDVQLLIYRKVFMGVWLAISGFGIVTNVINILTYIKLGLGESITVSFFALALSDLNACILDFATTVSLLFAILTAEFNVWFYVAPMVPTVYFVYVRRIFSHISISITNFLAVQRCICVVLPFEVKGLFSRSRTFWYIMIMAMFCTTSRALIIARLHVMEVTNEANNATYLITYFIPGSEFYIYFNTVIMNLLFGIASPILIVVCLIIMGMALRKSTKFRQSSAASSETGTGTGTHNARSVKNAKKDRKPPSKESQALMQVTLVAVVFVLTSLPMLGTALTAMFVPDFGLHRAFKNLYHLMGSMGVTGEELNASCNFIIYYHFNSRFRKVCFAGRTAGARKGQLAS